MSIQTSSRPKAGDWEIIRAEAERLAAALPPLLVENRLLTSAAALGVHGRRKVGQGESFWQFRRYRSEDPATAIDWRQSARTQNYYVREREWEAAESVWFWRDASPGMHFSSAENIPAKETRASVLALALASALVRGGERVGLWGDDRPPSAGRIALSRLTHALSLMQGEALPPAIRTGKRGALVWISDFLLPLDVIETRIRALAHTGLTGYLVQIADPAEEDFPYAGRVRFEAPGTKTGELIGRAEGVRTLYQERLKAHLEALGQMARSLGWSFTRHRTDKSAQTALVALFTALSGGRF